MALLLFFFLHCWCPFLPTLALNTHESFEQCDNFLELFIGQKIYVNSPNYPNRYPEGISCRYLVQAPDGYALKFRCDIELKSQSTTHCTNDIFYFNREGSEELSTSEYFCGSGRVERQSFRNRAAITYISRTSGHSYNGRSSHRNTHLQQPVERTITTNLTLLTTSESIEDKITQASERTATTTLDLTTILSPSIPNISWPHTRRPPTNADESHKGNKKLEIEEADKEQKIAEKSNKEAPNAQYPANRDGLDALLSLSKWHNNTLQVHRGNDNNIIINNRNNTGEFTLREPYETARNANGGTDSVAFIAKPQVEERNVYVASNAAANAAAVRVADDAARVINTADFFTFASNDLPHNQSSNWSQGSGGSFSCLIEVEESPSSSSSSSSSASKPSPSSCECGWSMTTKIAGEANEAEINDFPSMAGVVTVNHNQIFCGATIIHQRYLFSAAHCFLAPERGRAHLLRVLVGESDLTTVFDSPEAPYFYEIEKLLIHEGFLSKGDIVQHDIALLRTRYDIQWNLDVGPACLPFDSIEYSQRKSAVKSGQTLETAGWGTTYFGGPQPKRLLKTRLNVVTTEHCKHFWPVLSTENFCTYTHDTDTCQYDSGGALYLRRNRLFAVGIVSYGFACLTGVPSVNVDLGAYLEWIESKTPEVKYCRKH